MNLVWSEQKRSGPTGAVPRWDRTRLAGQPVVCLKLLTLPAECYNRSSYKRPALAVLVLRPVAEQSCYERIGIGYILDEAWFNELHQQKLTLV